MKRATQNSNVNIRSTGIMNTRRATSTSNVKIAPTVAKNVVKSQKVSSIPVTKKVAPVKPIKSVANNERAQPKTRQILQRTKSLEKDIEASLVSFS